MDFGTGKRLVFLNNHFGLPAETVSVIYKSYRQIELFFEWIKQTIRMKASYGTTELGSVQADLDSNLRFIMVI